MSTLTERVEIASPQQPHCAIVLLLDCSTSMEGEKILMLNEGLRIFKDEVSADDLAEKRVDLAVVCFGSDVRVVHDFSGIDEFEPPPLLANGSTPMGKAIIQAIELIERRKAEYDAKGIDYFRPWIFLITDGEPTDMQPGDAIWDEVVKRVHEGEANKKFLFFAVVAYPGNAGALAQIAPPNRRPMKLHGVKFKEMFEWLSRSQIRVSKSSVGDKVDLESPVDAGWGGVAT